MQSGSRLASVPYQTRSRLVSLPSSPLGSGQSPHLPIVRMLNLKP